MPRLAYRACGRGAQYRNGVDLALTAFAFGIGDGVVGGGDSSDDVVDAEIRVGYSLDLGVLSVYLECGAVDERAWLLGHVGPGPTTMSCRAASCVCERPGGIPNSTMMSSASPPP